VFAGAWPIKVASVEMRSDSGEGRLPAPLLKAIVTVTKTMVARASAATGQLASRRRDELIGGV